MGGYSVPSFSTFGSQVHQFSLGMLSITIGTCWPQPHQEVFSEGSLVRTTVGGSGEEGTAGSAGSGFAHLVGEWLGELGGDPVCGGMRWGRAAAFVLLCLSTTTPGS